MSGAAASASRYDVAAWVLTAAALVFVLLAHLVPALLAGLLVFEVVHTLAPRLRIVRIGQNKGKVAVVALLAVTVVAGLVLAIFGTVLFFRSDAGNLSGLLNRMAEIIESFRPSLPAWLSAYVPGSAADVEEAVAGWLRTHAGELQAAGKEAGRIVLHILVGMAIGAMVSLSEARFNVTPGPLAASLAARARRLGDAFRRVVFAQVRISAVNTVLTGGYLAVALPMFGVHLPLTKTMIAVTFLAGLLPVLGNLISNTVIVIVSLSHSLGVVVASLVFLIVVHKLEYFLNARIVGTEIRARAWELLVAMLAMEAAFGIPGVIAAPVFYAYAKDELAARGLI